MISLHARRSSASINAFATALPFSPLIVVLTGTDLCRDIRIDASAQRSMQLATQLMVLQPAGLPGIGFESVQAHGSFISPCHRLKSIAHDEQARYFDVAMIGYLREEKEPAAVCVRSQPNRYFPCAFAAHRWSNRGLAGGLAVATQAEFTHYRWPGHMPHAATRQRLKRSQLMVIASRMEGGANVIIEAIASGVPALASDISGNRGMLGEEYFGYFPQGDSRKLAEMIDRAATHHEFYRQMMGQCAARRHLFTPAAETAAALQLMHNYRISNEMDLGQAHIRKTHDRASI